MSKISVARIANGALVEQVNNEIEKVLANILDTNTEHKKKRTITVTLEFTGNSDRDVSDIVFKTKSVLAPQKELSTRVAFDRQNGKIVSEELRSNAIKG